MEPIYERNVFGARLAVFGWQHDFKEMNHVALAAKACKIKNVCLIRPYNATATCYEFSLAARKAPTVTVLGVHITLLDFKVDGLIFPEGMAVGILTADCPAIISRDGLKFSSTGTTEQGKFFVGHGGRRSLINHENVLITDPEQFQGKEGIIQDLFDKGWCKTNSQFFTACGIAPESFRHAFDAVNQKPSNFNERMITYVRTLYSSGEIFWHNPDDGVNYLSGGHFDLSKLAEAQAREFGDYVGPIFEGDGFDTFTDRRFQSRRRGDRGNNLTLYVT